VKEKERVSLILLEGKSGDLGKILRKRGKKKFHSRKVARPKLFVSRSKRKRGCCARQEGLREGGGGLNINCNETEREGIPDIRMDYGFKKRGIGSRARFKGKVKV